METIETLQAKFEALTSENASLKEVLEQVEAQRFALDQTVVEILKVNINLKASLSILEKRINILNGEIANYKSMIVDLNSKQVEATNDVNIIDIDDCAGDKL